MWPGRSARPSGAPLFTAPGSAEHATHGFLRRTVKEHIRLCKPVQINKTVGIRSLPGGRGLDDRSPSVDDFLYSPSVSPISLTSRRLLSYL
jgi:hypothetical protein